jgi:DNA-binding transcriptional ArsR family regulator
MAVHYVEPLDHTFHALGDPTRRGMLGLLAERGECTAGELGKPFEISQPSASKHIQVLEKAGLVSRRMTGRVHRFRLETGPMSEAEAWIVRHREFWKASLDALEGYLKGLHDKKGGNA